MQLLERADELRALGDALEGAIEGRGSVVLIAGEAGIGKTSLIQTFTAAVGERATVLNATCEDLLTPRPLGPIRDIASEIGGSLADLEARGDEGRLVTELNAYITSCDIPVLLVVEDIHWADDATLDALRFLARRAPQLPMVLIASYRHEELSPSHPLLGLLGGLTDPGVERLTPRPLSAPAVEELIAERGIDADSLHAATGGNPFYVAEVLAAGDNDVPPTVRDAVLARVGRLSEKSQAALRKISVIPTHVELWLANAIHTGAPTALGSAEQAGILGASATHVWFRHELARRAIETSVPVLERVEYNRIALAALMNQNAEPSRIVHHANAAEDVEVILEYGPIAASQAAALGSHRQVADLLALILGHSDRIDPMDRAAAYSDRAYSLYLLNRLGEATAEAEEAVAQWSTLADPVRLGAAFITLSRATFWHRGPLAARHAAERAVEILEPLGESPELANAFGSLARAHSNLATVGVVSEPATESISYADRAIELAGRFGRDDLVSHALNYRGSGRLSVGDGSGADDFDRALELVAGDPRIEFTVRACVNAAGAAHRAGHLAEAEEYIERGLEYGAFGEFYAGEYRLELSRQAVAATKGDWDAAESGLRMLIARPGEPGIMLPLAQQLLGRVRARRGDDRARETIESAAAVLATSEDIAVVGPITAALVESAWLGGSTDSMSGLATAGLRLAREQDHLVTQSEVTRYMQRAGHSVSELSDAVDPWRLGLEGRWREAADAWGELGDRYEMALELLSSNEIVPVTEAVVILDDLGADAAAAIARRWLRDAGVASVPRGQQRSTKANPAGLTNRQLEVLGLIADGLTNAQIADRLYLSVRTVDHHVSAVLTKLDVATRQEAAAEAERLPTE